MTTNDGLDADLVELIGRPGPEVTHFGVLKYATERTRGGRAVLLRRPSDGGETKILPLRDLSRELLATSIAGARMGQCVWWRLEADKPVPAGRGRVWSLTAPPREAPAEPAPPPPAANAAAPRLASEPGSLGELAGLIGQGGNDPIKLMLVLDAIAQRRADQQIRDRLEFMKAVQGATGGNGGGAAAAELTELRVKLARLEAEREAAGAAYAVVTADEDDDDDDEDAPIDFEGVAVKGGRFLFRVAKKWVDGPEADDEDEAESDDDEDDAESDDDEAEGAAQ